MRFSLRAAALPGSFEGRADTKLYVDATRRLKSCKLEEFAEVWESAANFLPVAALEPFSWPSRSNALPPRLAKLTVAGVIPPNAYREWERRVMAALPPPKFVETERHGIGLDYYEKVE